MILGIASRSLSFYYCGHVMPFASVYQVFSYSNKSDNRDVVMSSYSLQDGERNVANLLPASGFVTALVYEGRNLSADQILMR